jgi:ubiquinone biosynthesis protein COQ4
MQTVNSSSHDPSSSSLQGPHGPQGPQGPHGQPGAPDAQGVPADLDAMTSSQRWKLAIALLRKVLNNPEDTEQVLVFLGVINSGRASKARVARFFADPEGAVLYAEHRTIDSSTVDIDQLAALPEGTLGHAYAAFLRSHGLTPEVFDGAPPGIVNPLRSYVVQRMRQTHDLWHVVTGCETDTPGELALQAFTYSQTRSPGSAFLAVFGALRRVREQHDVGILRDVLTLYRAGRRAGRLPTFAWEDHWATPLAEVRTMLGLPLQPPARAATAS